VLLVNVATTADACSAAERILDVVRAPFTLGEHAIMVTISIGIAVSAAGQRDAGELLRAADLALYRAKQTGKAHYEVFEAGMAARAQALLELEVDLRGALERGELRIHYQPNVELDTGRVVGVEALLRWEHPHRGLVSPDMFIPIAEETGLILPIECWVLAEACRQTRTWQTMSPGGAELELSVNLSPSHFQHPELIAEVRAALDATGLHPGSLILEITERAVMTNATANIATLHALKDLGVQLAIDDFGTGYSSLSYLHHFPVDILKIDRSFIDGLGQMAADTVIVRTVIALAQSLGLVVVAEGVETAEQVTQLRGLGCRLCQGFYFFRPLPSGEVDTLLVRDG
jgi:EAL domain-containing protein (putative c-di-GMP-specific phosphodiesterase class I)